MPNDIMIGHRFCKCGKPAKHLLEKSGRWVCDLNLLNCPWWRKALEKGKDRDKLRT